MKACIAIGVNKVEGAANLPVLAAAASGAEQFAAWARTQGFEACAVTDTKNPVTVKAIRDLIAEIAKANTCTQLIVYFAGHGILKSADTEMWLLSEAATDANAAVNLVGSVRLARNCGIPHLIFVSDACRSLAADPRLSEVTGSSIFPIDNTRKKRPEVDIFYATLPGDVSWEVPAKEAAERYAGIFTKCLLDGLRSPDADLVESVDGDGGARLSVVSSRTLKPWLEARVPDAISDVDIKLTQFPEVRVESQRPKYLAVVAAPPASASPAPPAFAPEPTKGPRPGLGERVLNYALRVFPIDRLFSAVSPVILITGGAPAIKFERRRPAPETRKPAARRPNRIPIGDTGHKVNAAGLDPAFENDSQTVVAGRHGFETRTGFSVTGATLQTAYINGQVVNASDIFSESGQWHLRVNPGAHGALSALLQFADGSGTCLAAVPGLIGSVVVESGRVASVNYTPSQYDRRFSDFEYNRAELDERRALAAAASKRGYFRVEPAEAQNYAESLRRLKWLDPALGIYSAYAYVQSGLMENVDSVYGYMVNDGFVPFDVALLAGKLDPAQMQHGLIAPFCPMLTQGWSLLDEDAPVSDAVRQAARYLTPALWTTLTEKGVEMLRGQS